VTGSAMCVGVGEAEVMRSEGQGAVAMVAMATPMAVGEQSRSVIGAGPSTVSPPISGWKSIIVHNVMNGQLVLPGGQRPQYIVQVQVQMCRKRPNIWGKYNIQIYTCNTPPSNSWWIHNTEFGE
jgi:hypothetical protein